MTEPSSAPQIPVPLVITAAAALSPLGIGFGALADGLAAGVTKLGPLTLFGTTLSGGEVWDFDPEALLGRKGLRLLDRNTRLVLACIQRDLVPSIEAIGAANVGLALGTTFGSFTSLSDFAWTYLTEGFRALNPRHFPNLVINAPPSQGNIRFGLTASSTTLTNGTTSGIDAILYAAMRLRCGDEAAFICGGAEELSQVLCEAGSWSPGGVVRPMDPDRDGSLPGEGAAMFLLEPAAAAAAAGRTAMATLEAGANCAGPTQLVPSAPAGAWVIRETLRKAQLTPADIDFVSISANGSQAKDLAERNALGDAFGETRQLPLLAYAGYGGSADAASSALQVAAALACLERGCIPPTPHAPSTEAIAGEVAPFYFPQRPLHRPLQRCMVLSLGDTGGASALILRKDIGDEPCR